MVNPGMGNTLKIWRIGKYVEILYKTDLLYIFSVKRMFLARLYKVQVELL